MSIWKLKRSYKLGDIMNHVYCVLAMILVGQSIWEFIATFCFYTCLQYLGCPVSHTKSLQKDMPGKVDFWAQTVDLYDKSLITGNIYNLNSMRPGVLLH